MQPRKTNSEIILGFTEAQQQLEIQDQIKQTNQLVQAKNNERRKFHSEKKKQKSKQQVSFNESLNKAEKFRNMDDHRIDLQELYKRLDVDPEQGLNSQDVDHRIKQYGHNVLSERKGLPWYIEFIHELVGFFSLILWFGAALCLIAYFLDTSDPSNLYLAIVLALCVTITGTVTFLQNRQASSIMTSFKNFIPPKCTTYRNGKKVQINASELVPGDIVEIKSGDRIPADIRIIFQQEMKVDHSSLNGESDLLSRSIECTNQDNPLETKNLCFFGTMCKEGIGRGIVIKTGDNTVIGQIANLAASADGEVSPLRKEIDRFIIYIAVLSLTLGGVFFIFGFILGYSAITNLVFAICMIVANIPEGLYATITISLTLTAKRLAVRKVLVKKLEAVETLGASTCICSDKTGTLTQNKMTVENLWYDGKIFKGHNQQKYGKKHNFEYNTEDIGFKTLHEAAMTCSEAIFNNAVPQEKFDEIAHIHNPQQQELKKKQIEQAYIEELQNMLWLVRPTIGDASETALIRFFQPIEDIIETRKRHQVAVLNDGTLAKMPFNSTNKFALIICKEKTQDSDYCLYIKGAPEKIWGFCTEILINNRVLEIDDHWQNEFKKVNLTFGKQGERVLGFAKLPLPRGNFSEGYQFKVNTVSDFNFPLSNLHFIGLISLIDPPRDAVPFAVKKCQSAGIKVIMVTGDQPVTATAIARQCNIIRDKTADEIAEEQGISIDAAIKKANAIVIHGDMITEALREDEGLPENEKGRKLASWLLKSQIVFARTSPAQKLIIVQGCQKLGHVVAVTGDGVNDSPAIKKADIGISMGITGSDVAKDAADMILLTDDFAAIVIGIEEGRKIFDNIKKSIAYILISNGPEIIPFCLFMILQIPLPISTILILCIDIGTDMFPAVAFAYEYPELDIMTREPRSKQEHLVSARLLVYTYVQQDLLHTFGAFITYFVSMQDFGFRPTDLLFLILKTGVIPKESDVFDIDSPNFGNSNAYCKDGKLHTMFPQDTAKDNTEPDKLRVPDWLYTEDDIVDLRMYYLECTKENKLTMISDRILWDRCRLHQISSISKRPVCYTTESLRYTQTAYFISTVMCQITNFIACKTRKLSIIYQGWRNMFMILSFWMEICICLILSFVIPLNTILGTRDITFLHFGQPALIFAGLIIVYDEIKKYLIRNWQLKPNEKQNWFERNCLW